MNNKLEEIKLQIENGVLNLENAYIILGSIAQERPELANNVLNTINETLKSEKNNGGSLCWAYGALDSIAKKRPELANNVLNTINEALKSEKNDKYSLRDAYIILGSIAKKRPELAKDAFVTFSETLKSEKNNGVSLAQAYKVLSSIAKERPELAKDAFATFNKAAKSEKNNGDSLKGAYETLGSIAKERPELAKDAFATFSETLKSEKNDKYSLRDAYIILGSIAQERPELAKDAFVTFSETLKSEENDKYSLRDAYKILGSIAQERPELANNVLNTINEALKSEKNDGDSLRDAYIILGSIAQERPELAKDAFVTFSEALKSEKNDGDSLYWAYKVPGSIAQKRPELAKDAFATFNKAAKSEKNNGDSLRVAYIILGSIVKEQPDLANNVLNTINEALKSEKNNGVSLAQAYKVLSSIAQERPELAKDAFVTFSETLKSEENDGDSLRDAYKILDSIAKERPELANNVLNTINEALKSEENDGDSLRDAYKILDSIAKERPELANNVLNTINEALKSEKNDGDSLYWAYKILDSIAQERPELANNVLNTINEALKSEKNDGDSLYWAYKVPGSIAQKRPELANNVLNTINEALKSEKNNYYSLAQAYETLGSIAKERPEFAKDVVNAIIFTENCRGKTYLLSRCMKNCRPDDFPEVRPEQKQELQAAHIMRFSTEEEIEYLYTHNSMDKIAEIKLSAQQRCMNVIIAQLGKEQNIEKSEVINYRKNPENKTYKDNVDWLIPASFKAAELFGCYFPSYIKQTEGYLNTHDSVYWLPKDMGKEKNQSFVSFVQRNLIYEANGEKKCRNLAEMDVIAKNWQYLKPEDYKLKYKDVLAICRSRKYKDQEHVNFAAEAAKWGVTERQYKDWEDVYAAGLKVPEPFDSSKRFEFGNYCGRFLPRDDVRTGFFGGYTNCCQHFDGVGKECAISTIKDPYSQLFVIESKETGKIIAGSWVWENTEGTHRDVCFDNIEAIGEFKKHPMLNHIYDMAGRYLTEEENCRKVTIGMGYQDAETSKYTVVDNIPLPTQYNDEYSDAKGTQVLLAQNPKAQPLDKSQESVRFVREACFLDWDAMNSVSEKCFPDGDQRLQSPDRLTGLALVDKDKGVVGYCLYDKDERYISDMAVLPEYRTDENASSRKLFAEVIKKVKEIGGEWSAELRDNTTYRYIEVMQHRGLVDFETHGVDHEMSDGSKVYAVTFKVNDTPTPHRKLKQNIHCSGKDGR